MTLEEKLKEVMDGLIPLCGTANIEPRIEDIISICKQEIEEACKKAKIEELGKFLIIVSGATDILDRMQTIEVLHNRIMELDKPPSLEPKLPLDEVK